MKRLIVLSTLLLLNLSSEPVFSQENIDTTKVQTNIFQNFSFQFQVKLFELQSFQGGLISFKYHFNDNFAFRAGFGLTSNNSNANSEREITTGGDYSSNSSSDNNMITFEFPGQFLYYLKPEKDIKLFVGLGPYFSYSKRNLKTDNRSYPENSASFVISENKHKTYSIGLSSAYGVEWFFTENLSLTAEYGFRFIYFFDKTQTAIKDGDNSGVQFSEYRTSDEDGWRFSSSSVLFGLSVYL